LELSQELERLKALKSSSDSEKTALAARVASLEAGAGLGNVANVGCLHGYGSIPINTIFRGMNIHKSQLF